MLLINILVKYVNVLLSSFIFCEQLSHASKRINSNDVNKQYEYA